MENKLTSFEGQDIRKTWHDDEWFFVLDDVFTVLTDTKNPKAYWSNLRRKDEELKKGYGKIYSTLAVETEGGKQKMNCANTEGVFRILMSISSPKVEPLKIWLASLGKQAIVETGNPELLTERQAELYRAKGYSEEWITRRVQTIETRKALTDEWQQRGVKDNQEYAILTATIAKGTFGIAPSDHKDMKGLTKQNLRDHMTPLELAFTALSEEITRTVTVRDDAQGFNETMDAAIEGGSIAGEARINAEKRLGQKVVSPTNYLGLIGEEKGAENLPEVPPTDET
jgi:DNA-damage-inducible protein D